MDVRRPGDRLLSATPHALARSIAVGRTDGRTRGRRAAKESGTGSRGLRGRAGGSGPSAERRVALRGPPLLVRPSLPSSALRLAPAARATGSSRMPLIYTDPRRGATLGKRSPCALQRPVVQVAPPHDPLSAQAPGSLLPFASSPAHSTAKPSAAPGADAPSRMHGARPVPRPASPRRPPPPPPPSSAPSLPTLSLPPPTLPPLPFTDRQSKETHRLLPLRSDKRRRARAPSLYAQSGPARARAAFPSFRSRAIPVRAALDRCEGRGRLGGGCGKERKGR